MTTGRTRSDSLSSDVRSKATSSDGHTQPGATSEVTTGHEEKPNRGMTRSGTGRCPVYERLPRSMDAWHVFTRLCCYPRCLYLDSAVRDTDRGRYSFVVADPVRWWQPTMRNIGAALRHITQVLRIESADRVEGLPPFQGGIAGLISYDLGRWFEPTVPTPEFDDIGAPLAALGLYDVVAAFDHEQEEGWLISHGTPERNESRRLARARERLALFQERIRRPAADPGNRHTIVAHKKLSSPQFRVGPRHGIPSQLVSNFTASAYLKGVERVIQYIREGDVFQVNLSQRLSLPATTPPVSLYHRLRSCNAAPFAGYFDLGRCQVLSASPERFLSVTEGRVETRPIKGTRAVSRDRPLADLYAGAELQQSNKDRAENVMIVDLLRNDLSRVCTAESVTVPQLCRLETYAYVQHLVSIVTGDLSPRCEFVDLLAATYPGGSITGAPKVRAMQIIAELERVARGPYCGSLGYVSLSGDADWNLLIRTITARNNWWHFPVGGGIVADSDPEREYAETWHKAEGMLRALDN